ncbi:pantetheine-phosphate adenylyltransferase [Terrihabitans rhizophilus]|uniref:Phosphopantetheine adenylyltransferase n=1 Tax=Terrihabitans rhizophilus TaxID=3092662 RepID=A0ABU4RKE3_9HYPH|nr:pantetheine-phosphate adenylyltransferase [Terrihabitans sp. PJ23]MDX6805309.1 pantetheine-phosphate adenylyltransferase [Terrihabitans sp. PJ23]
MIRTALYAGSFDPVTNGHVDVLRSAAFMFDRVVLAVGTHHAKTPMLSAEDRVSLLKQVCAPIGLDKGCDVRITTFNGLVIDAARQADARFLIRGLRNGTDFDYEMQMAGMNAALAPDIHTICIPASVASRPITATLVRQIAAMGGDISAFVPQPVAAKLAEHLSGSSEGESR